LDRATSGGNHIDDINAIFRSLLWRIGGLKAVRGVLVVLGRGIVRPINAMTASMRKLPGLPTKQPGCRQNEQRRHA
jgi:hypothetical protein